MNLHKNFANGALWQDAENVISLWLSVSEKKKKIIE